MQMRMIRICIHNTGLLGIAAALATLPALAAADAAETDAGDLRTVVIEATSTAGPAVSPTGASQ